MDEATCCQLDVKLRVAVAAFRGAVQEFLAFYEKDRGGRLKPQDIAAKTGLPLNTVKGYVGTGPVADRLPRDTAQLDALLNGFSFSDEGKADALRLRGAVEKAYDDADEERGNRKAHRLEQKRGFSKRGEELPAPDSSMPSASHSPAFGARFDIRALEPYARSKLIGRKNETRRLVRAFTAMLRGASRRPRVLTFFAWPGEGKTSIASHWAVGLRARAGRPGFPPVFAYSFFRQGADGELETSSYSFFNAALEFFGAADSAPKAPVDRAEFVASLVEAHGAVVILDGIEPLQLDPSAATPGLLKDVPLGVMLKAIGQGPRGLCVVTTRYRIADLDVLGERVAPQIPLSPLSEFDSLALLRSLRLGRGRRALALSGTDVEFESLARWSGGHALTLNLVGSYLLLAHRGHVRKYDVVRLKEADDEVATGPMGSGHAAKVMDAYVRWFEQGDEKGRRALVLLRALGLFDRPATVGCLTALLEPDAIAGFTEPLLAPTSSQLEVVCRRLEEAGLITSTRNLLDADRLSTIDAHPLVRAYFADHLRRQQPPTAWIEANERLYEHLCRENAGAEPSGVAQLEPLYQAIVHGCRAGRYQAAYDDVFDARICQGARQLSTGEFGAFNHDLSALSSFFERPWERLASALEPATRMRVASVTAFRLRSVGRFDEARPLMELALRFYEEASDWRAAASEAGNLSVLLMHAGDLSGSVGCARRALAHAARTGDMRLLRDRHATLGDPLIQLGPSLWPEARETFEQAEALQAALEPERRQLYSTKGYRFHELLLELGETDELLDRCERSRTWIDPQYQLLDRGLNRLMHGRALLARARQSARLADWRAAKRSLVDAMGSLRLAGFQENLARGLIAQAEVHAHDPAGLDLARKDLDHAWTIAVTGRMPLFQIDIRLTRLRLFTSLAVTRPASAYPWKSPSEDLRVACELIARHGYLRRQAEAEALASRLQPQRKRPSASVRPA